MTPSRGRAVLNFKNLYLKGRNFIRDHLGWPILACGLGITLIFTLIYDGLNLEGSEIVDYIRTAVLTIGALGGAYGLVLAARRQKVLEEQTRQGQEQTKQGQAQLFNDRLGRGAEMLGHESMAVRVAGIKVLEDLALSSDKKEIIYEILDKFLQNKATIRRDSDGKQIPPSDIHQKSDRHDVFASAEALIKIDQQLMRRTRFQTLDLDQFPFPKGIEKRASITITQSNCYNAQIVSTNINAHFDSSRLEVAQFFYSNLTSTYFKNAFLKYARFEYTNLSGVSFEGGDLEEATFFIVDCTGISFSGVQNLSGKSFNIIFYLDGKAPRQLPKDTDLSQFHAYQWVKRNDKDYRRLVNADNSLTKDEIFDFEFELNKIPGGPFKDD